jgi:hypothetical protein
MEQPVSRATVIHLEHFPAYEVPTIKKNLVPNIAKYLKGLLSDKLYSPRSVCCANFSGAGTWKFMMPLKFYAPKDMITSFPA